MAGGHTDPESVLTWLCGDAPDPWYRGSGWGDGVVLDELRKKIGSH